MVQIPDSLEILLPGAGEPFLRRARNVVQFLRLLAADAQPARAASVGVGLEQARCELEKQDRRRLEDALADLLRHHLAALATADTFLAWGEPVLDHAGAWRVLDEFRGELTWLSAVPEPGRSAAAMAARLLENHARLGAPAADTVLWTARIARFTEGPRAAEELLRARLADRDRGNGDDRRCLRALAACLVECLLDRGAVREARAWFQENAARIEGDPRLRQLLSWTLVLAGDYAGAKSAIVGMPAGSVTLPAALADLRAQRPEWLPCLAGRAPPERAPSLQELRPGPALHDRSSIGAAVLGLFAIEPDGRATALRLDVAPALRPGVEAWLADRDGACAIPGEREHELVVAAKVIPVRREGDRPCAGALGRDVTMSMALVPILDEDGEVAGWIHIECEHHRLPSLAALAELAAASRDEVLARNRPERRTRREDSGAAAPRSDTGPVSTLHPGCAGVFEELVSELGIKTAQRRWWGFVMEGFEPRLVATGGEGSGLSPAWTGRGRALTRAAATRGPVAFDAPEPRLALDEKAGSGVVLPLIEGEIVCGLLAIESSRRRDFREPDLARFAESAARCGLVLALARFAAWHRESFGFDVSFDTRHPGFRAFAGHLLAAARSRAPVVLCGPSGAGKTILARWLHFASPRSAGPHRSVDCGSLATRQDVRDAIEAARGGSLVLESLEALTAPGQEELLRVFDGSIAASAGHPRVFATTRLGLVAATAANRLRGDLAHCLDRVQLKVPALRERREEIPALVACLARRFAEEEELSPPVFSDDALAWLWRQPWEGNVRELESFVYKLVLFGRNRRECAQEVIGPERVQTIAARFSLALARRLPSRHPQKGDLLAALRVTRKAGGRLNKTRAALYLGWDPDTLVARMQDAGIGEEVGDEETWPVAMLPEKEDPESER